MIKTSYVSPGLGKPGGFGSATSTGFGTTFPASSNQQTGVKLVDMQNISITTATVGGFNFGTLQTGAPRDSSKVCP